MAELNNLGVPPLAGIATYEEASRAGLGVDESVERLRRLEYMARRLHLIGARLLPTVPEWEVKCGLGVHGWMDAELCGAIQRRINELRHPSLKFDSSPDEELTAAFDKLGESASTLELLGGLERARRELLGGIDDYLASANPLADFPTVHLLRKARPEQEMIFGWTSSALEGLTRRYEEEPGAVPEPATGSAPRRDPRFRDTFNTSAKIDQYYKDESRPIDERAFALAYKRLREMDVPEWMGPILSSAKDRPWEYHVDLSRQLSDETRHAMMGEVALHSYGVPHYSYPVPINAVEALNSRVRPARGSPIALGHRAEPDAGRHREAIRVPGRARAR